MKMVSKFFMLLLPLCVICTFLLAVCLDFTGEPQLCFSMLVSKLEFCGMVTVFGVHTENHHEPQPDVKNQSEIIVALIIDFCGMIYSIFCLFACNGSEKKLS